MHRLGLVFLVLIAITQTTAAQWRPGGVMRIVLLVDSSSSVAPMITPMRAALNSFVDDLPGEPEVTFITTGGQIRIRVPPTSDRKALREATERFAADGGANAFIDTMIEADQRFLKKAPDRRPVFVIITTDAGTTLGDQRVDTYNRFAQDFVGRGGRAHVIVIRGQSSGLTSMVAENLAENSGGYFQTINVASAIPRTMKTLMEYVAADQ